MSDDTVLDTTIHEPPPTADEIEMLLFALQRGRATFAWKVSGLDAAGLRKPLPPSTMTLGGILKHLARIEDMRVFEFLTGEPPHETWDPENFARDPDWDWNSAADDSPETLYALWNGAVARSSTAWNQLLANGDLGQPSRFEVEGWGRPNLRRVLIDTIEEYTRHLGHADLLRENVDGLVGMDPPQS